MQTPLIILLFFMLWMQPIPASTPQNAIRGTTHTIVVRLETQSGTPIENATVHLYHMTHNILLDTSKTNQTGYAIFQWQISPTHELGQILLNATFRGDPERFLLPCHIIIPITISSQTERDLITFLFQTSLIAFGSLGLGSMVAALKIRRTTKNIVAH